MSYGIAGKHILLGVCGGIAAYKSVELLRLINKQGAGCQVIMTANATHFIGPMTFEALSRRKVCSDLFQPQMDASIHHIEWAREADVVVIAPATANMIGKMANGLADDALSTLLLAATCPVLVCPAMNTHMYLSHAVQRNLEILRSYGVHILEPDEGEMACGTIGPGRLPEPAVIADRLEKLLCTKDFQNRHVLVTAGPTREVIDPVRFISNPSSGKMGYALARAAEMRGADVVLISGPVSLPAPHNVTVIPIISAAEMAGAVFEHLDRADVLIKNAAVLDFRPTTTHAHKVKKDQANSVITLERTEDILKTVAQRKRKDQVIVGFAAETRDIEAYAKEKLHTKNMDMIVANFVDGGQGAFGSDTNQVSVFYPDGHSEQLDRMPKAVLAHALLDRIVKLNQ